MSEQQREKGKQEQSSQPGPSTNTEAVPGGLEGSIHEGEDEGEPGKKGRTADRARGNERRSDEN